MPEKLFGTDGVRGVAGSELTAELALAIGCAATTRTQRVRPQVVIVRDTRESGEMLEAAIAAGISAAGGEVLLAGVLPTPAVPLLLKRYELDLGIVISASHNPYADNGIKIFGSDGFKLSDQMERSIEADVLSRRTAPGRRAAGRRVADEAMRRIGRIRSLQGGQEDYLRELQARFSELSLAGLEVALDCANGATWRVAPRIFERLGAKVSAFNVAPDGRNINSGCGSTHVECLAQIMRSGAHDIGFAFDGDGDRVLAVDRSATIVDGDELIALIAAYLHADGRLAGGGVAVTVMSNFGFHAAMRDAGIEVATTSVGDRHVLEELRARGWVLGGEQSGHIVDLGFNRSGDGIAAALLTLEALAGEDLARRPPMKRLPQRLVNVQAAEPGQLLGAPAIAAEIDQVAQQLQGRGRVLVRASGTEPLIRVMVEAPTEREASELCERLAALLAADVRRLGG